MKILFLGEYDPAEIVLAPIKVGKELFKSFINSGHNIYYLPYFQDGIIHSRFKNCSALKKLLTAFIEPVYSHYYLSL